MPPVAIDAQAAQLVNAYAQLDKKSGQRKSLPLSKPVPFLRFRRELTSLSLQDNNNTKLKGDVIGLPFAVKHVQGFQVSFICWSFLSTNAFEACCQARYFKSPPRYVKKILYLLYYIILYYIILYYIIFIIISLSLPFMARSCRKGGNRMG